MKRAALMTGLWLAWAGGALAQVSVEIVLEQEQLLRNESFPIKVRIVNSSGQTLRIGSEPDWLVFTVLDADGRGMPALEKVELVDAFNLEAAKVANLTTDLMPYYDLGKVGKYTVHVTLKVDQLGQTFAATPKSFDVISGTKLWEREFGVPSPGVPEVRKYALQQANFLKQLRLYARITDPREQKVFRVVSLGALLSFSKPEAQLDKSSQLHVLFQNSAATFLYQVITPDGEVVIRQTHEYYQGSRPTLRHEGEEGVRVTGGRRRVVLSDLPPPSLEPLPEPLVPEVAPTNLPTTNAPTTTNPPPKAPAKSAKPAKKPAK